MKYVNKRIFFEVISINEIALVGNTGIKCDAYIDISYPYVVNVVRGIIAFNSPSLLNKYVLTFL